VYAKRQHLGQRRGADGAPFIAHPIEVGSLLYRVGAPDDVIAAGLLHDTIEKTSTTAEDLHRQFGARVATLVLAVSEDPGIARWQSRKAALRRQVAAAGREALMVFAADKVSKARELPSAGAAGQASTERRVRNRKLAHYEHCAELLERSLSDSPLVGNLRAELTRLGVGERTGRTAFAGAA
jgi:(p)ppGpp synthase/HD superfamily hydrolase